MISINFSGDSVPERVLYQLAMALRDEIEAIPSVLEATLSGHREELLEAVIEPTLLDSYGITMGEVANSIMRNNRLIAAGSLDTGQGRFSIKVPSVIESAKDLFDIPIKTVNGTVVTIADRFRQVRAPGGRFRFRPLALGRWKVGWSPIPTGMLAFGEWEFLVN